MMNKPLKIGLILLLIFFFFKSSLFSLGGGFGGLFFAPMALIILVVGLCYTGVGLVRLKNKVPEIEATTTKKPFISTPMIIILIVFVAIILGFLFIFFSTDPLKITEEECINRGGKIVTLSDQLEGKIIFFQVLGNIKQEDGTQRQDGSQCVI